MELGTIDACIDDWETLSDEYKHLQRIHIEYQNKLKELTDLQQKCTKGIGHQRYRMNIIRQSLKNVKPEKQEIFKDIQLREQVSQRSRDLGGIEDGLPKKNGLYLRIILGNLNVCLPTKRERYEYKKEFERFKLVVMLVSFCTAIVGLFIHNRGLDMIGTFLQLWYYFTLTIRESVLMVSYGIALLPQYFLNIYVIYCFSRVVDLIGIFLLLWYYCTLTIRESILMVNGSKHGIWQITLHFVATVMSGIIAIFPNGENYDSFRTQLLGLVAYYSFIQYIQYKNGVNILYKERAMGRTHSMHVTSEGFQPYMLSGMTYILPFLFVAYFWELYNAVTMYNLAQTPSAHWHEMALCIIFSILFLGNTITTTILIPFNVAERLAKIWPRKGRKKSDTKPKPLTPIHEKQNFF